MIELTHISKNFASGGRTVHAVQDVSLSIGKGEIFGIIGFSGAGKSTLVRCINLLERPTSGSVTVDGKEMTALSARELRQARKKIGMIFQDPMTSLNPLFTVGDQLTEPLRIHKGISKKEARDLVLEKLRMVEIPDPESRMKQYPHELSGGMRQRIMIAMAIMCNPRLIIADEPTTALDVTIQAQILDLLQSLQKKLGTAVIMITHDLGVIAGMCSRVLVMYGGVVVEEGTVREIFYEPKHPYTWGLLRSIPQKSGEKRKLIPIPGSPPDLIAPPPGCPFVARCPYAMNICNSALPEMTRLSQTHCARCRLLDEGAPRIVWEGNRE